jgi:hypothetical protein
MRELTEVDIVHNPEMSCYGFGACEMITGGIGDDVFDPLLEGYEGGCFGSRLGYDCEGFGSYE